MNISFIQCCRDSSNEARTHSFSAPAIKKRTHVDNAISPQGSRNPRARLPPLHPNRSHHQIHPNECLKAERHAQGSEGLKIGDFEVCIVLL